MTYLLTYLTNSSRETKARQTIHTQQLNYLAIKACMYESDMWLTLLAAGG